MGIESKEDTQTTAQNIMSISSDQLSELSSKGEQKAKQSTTNESAAIAVAKEAAESYVKDHPADTLFKKEKKGDQVATPEKKATTQF